MKSEYFTQDLKWLCVTNHIDGKTFMWDESFINPSEDCSDNAIYEKPVQTSNPDLFLKHLMRVFE